MSLNKRIKISVDVIMSVILMVLMAQQVTETARHEVIGTVMLTLFIIHNALNYRWYKGLLKGKYSLIRTVWTILDILVILSLIITGCSGIVLSRNVFAALPIKEHIAIARKIHLAGPFWSFSLMGIHLGWHVRLPFLKVSNEEEAKKKTYLSWGIGILAFAFAVYGAVISVESGFYVNMFLKTEFAVLDYESSAGVIIFRNIIMFCLWVFMGYCLMTGLSALKMKAMKNVMIKAVAVISLVAISLTLPSTAMQEAGWNTGWNAEWNAERQGDFVSDEGDSQWSGSESENTEENYKENEIQSDKQIGQQNAEGITEEMTEKMIQATEDFVFIQGGSFQMGSPESEHWRSQDETQHEVSVGDFYLSKYEVTQEEYQIVTGDNPSMFSGDDLPIESITWMEAVSFCNALSEKEGLSPAYQITANSVTWNAGADGYRLPTEAEWEYACRAGTVTPFNTETSISAAEANYYGHYPLDIEQNYFSQNNLSTKPGEYRQSTVSVDSFEPNLLGLYNMHGNVSEWVWDYYGEYDKETVINPTGPEKGSLRVYRGGGWNDFGKNLRSAYRGTLDPTLSSFNVGLRLARNAYRGEERIIGASEAATDSQKEDNMSGKMLIAYFSWGGNTRSIAREIQNQTGADLFEITPVKAYSDDYNTVLMESQQDQNVQARPALTDSVSNMDEYEIVLLGYPNWWASIPMPVATFLESYDFSGKTVVPFCSHGGGRFGQSLTAISKLIPNAAMGEGLSVHYSGGSTLEADIEAWLKSNGIKE